LHTILFSNINFTRSKEIKFVFKQHSQQKNNLHNYNSSVYTTPERLKLRR